MNLGDTTELGGAADCFLFIANIFQTLCFHVMLSQDPIGVAIGGCIGHSVCTGMAVIGGRMLASRISEKSVAFYGGLVFLIFGMHSVFFEE